MISARALRQAERRILAPEHCSPSDAEIPFDWILNEGYWRFNDDGLRDGESGNIPTATLSGYFREDSCPAIRLKYGQIEARAKPVGVWMQTYDDIADMFERIATEHEKVSAHLRKRDDPEHDKSNLALAHAEVIQAEACMRAARALRGRSKRARCPPVYRKRRTS